jgi:hypothetical protein
MHRFLRAVGRRVLVSATALCAVSGAVAAAGHGQPTPHQPAAGGMAPGGPFIYASGTRRYRITSVDTRTQDQAGGRAPFEFATTTTQFVTMVLASKARDTLALTLTIDSVVVNSTLDAPAADVQSFRGARMEGTMSPQGKLYVFAPPAGVTDNQTISLYRAFSRFLTAVPPQLGPGTTWTDTSAATFKRGEFDIKTSTVTTSKVTADTTLGGQHAWRVERSAVIATSGEGKEKDKPIHLLADGTIRTVQFLSVSGIFLGSTGTQTNRVQMSMEESAGGVSSPIQEVIKSTVESLPAGGSAGQ